MNANGRLHKRGPVGGGKGKRGVGNGGMNMIEVHYMYYENSIMKPAENYEKERWEIRKSNRFTMKPLCIC
jgi:hypothetical protein